MNARIQTSTPAFQRGLSWWKKGIFRGNVCVEQSEDGIVEIIQNLIDFALEGHLTEEQKKNYSHDAQERRIRQLLIEPLGIRIMDEKRHIVHDTYTGLEYRYRQALEAILEMAERGEFDVLLMDVLDRGLGRKALAREMFRMQLRELGVRILTTQESDHADDDTLEGLVVRYHKGIKAEEEILDLVRRTSEGRRQKA